MLVILADSNRVPPYVILNCKTVCKEQLTGGITVICYSKRAHTHNMLGIFSDKETYWELCWHILHTNFDNEYRYIKRLYYFIKYFYYDNCVKHFTLFILPCYPLIKHILILKCDTYSDNYFSNRRCLRNNTAAKIYSKKSITGCRDNILNLVHWPFYCKISACFMEQRKYCKWITTVYKNKCRYSNYILLTCVKTYCT
jgi:hypothetical protein